MKNLKKVLALVVVFTMMLSTVAFAAYPDVAADADYATAVEVLSALEILQGDDQGNFNPDADITRAEFAAVVCRALGLEDSANGAKGATAFSDVAASHWATGYINLANQMGIINGMGDGTFAPEENVTYEQAVKMLTCALGYEYMAQTKGGWPTGYLVVANTYGVTAGVKATAGEPAARSIVAELTYNALDCPIMEQGTYGTEEYWYVYDGVTNTPKKTLLSEKLDVAKLTGVVTSNNKVGIGIAASEKGEFAFAIKEDVETKFKNDFTNGRTYTSLNVADSKADTFLGNKVDLYITEVSRNEWNALVLVPEDGKNVVTTFASSALDVNKTLAGAYAIYYEEEGKTASTKLEISADTQVVINNVHDAAYSTDYSTNPATAPTKVLSTDLLPASKSGNDSVHGRIKAIDWENDYTYDVVIVDTYKHAIVDSVNATAGIIRTKNYANIDVRLGDDNAIVTIKDVDGNDYALEDIAEGDVLAIITDNPAANPGSFTSVLDIVVIPEADATVTGTVTETIIPTLATSLNTTHKVYVDGEAYGFSVLDANNFEGWEKLDANSVGTFYLTIDGKIVGFEGDKAASGDYAFILESGISNTGIGAGELQIKVLTAEGEIVTYGVATNVTIPVVGNANASFDTSINGWYTDVNSNGTYDSGTDTVNSFTAMAAWDSTLVSAAQTKIAGEDASTTSIRELLANFSLPTSAAQYASRFVKLNVTSAGKINRIEVPGVTISGSTTTFTSNLVGSNATDKKEYKADAAQWGQNILADNAVVFVIDDGNDFADSKVSTVAESFIDENNYAGYVYDDVNGYKEAAMITAKDSKLGGGNGFAIVTTVTNITTENNEKALKVRVYQNGSSDEEAITVVAGEYTNITTGSKVSNATLPTLAAGDVIEYVADANGIVDTLAVVATRATTTSGNDVAGLTYIMSNFAKAVAYDNAGNEAYVKDVAYAYGYIENITGGNVVAIKGGYSDNNSTTWATPATATAYHIGDAANQYYLKHIDTDKYNLTTTSWWMGKVDKEYDHDNNAGTATQKSYVLIKLFDGKVVDILALDAETRVDVVDND